MAATLIEWYRIPVNKAELSRFTRKSDLRGFLQAGSFLLLFIATTGISFSFFWRHMWVAMVISCYLHSVFHQMVGMSAAVHELNHGTVFKTRWVNELFYKLFCFLTWNNPVHFRASHALHHQYTVFRELDKEVIQEPVKKTVNWLALISWLTFDYQWFWTLVRGNVLHVLGKGNVDFFSWDPLFAEDDPRRRQMIRWARFALASYVAMIVVFSVFHLWVLIYLLIFGNFFATILGRLTFLIQHMGLDENIPDWRMVCHTVKVHPIIGYLYWHMNYHIEHHMYAAVPFYNLPKFHDAIADQLPEGPKSFLEGLRLVLSIRKRQEEDPGYVYVPKFPETATPPKTNGQRRTG
jgi:fatty acid desaturase